MTVAVYALSTGGNDVILNTVTLAHGLLVHSGRNRNMNIERLSDTPKVELLKHFHQMARDEVNSFRERQDKIFTWSSSILFVVIGALLVIDQSKTLLWSSQGFAGKLIASLAVLVVVLFSIRWQQRCRATLRA